MLRRPLAILASGIASQPRHHAIHRALEAVKAAVCRLFHDRGERI
jgi:hypothetical protein